MSIETAMLPADVDCGLAVDDGSGLASQVGISH